MFYKNRYLIALYDKENYLINVFDNLKEFKKCYSNLSKNTVRCLFWQINNNANLEYKTKNRTIALIDTNKINDVFEEEDLIFDKELELEKFTNHTFSRQEITKMFNITDRTYFRWKEKNLINKKLNKRFREIKNV